SAAGVESVWNNGPRAAGGGASGGGGSRVFPRPMFQAGLAIPPAPGQTQPGRGVPDVAANANPESGYRIRGRGRDGVAGGTGAAAPLWAGLVARLNQHLGKPIGFFNPVLYSRLARSGAVRDITIGSNDTTGRLGGYHARRGWDAATGWGVPVGSRILDLLTHA